MKQKRGIFFGIILSVVFVGMFSACQRKRHADYDAMMAASSRLEIKTKDGGGYCTATAFEKNGDIYRFITAAHCVAKYNEATQETILKEATYKVVLEEKDGNKISYDAKVRMVGELKNSEDVAVVEAKIDKLIPLISIADSDPKLGEDVAIVTAPTFLGNELVKGYISKKKFNNNLIVSGVNWRGFALMQKVGLGNGQGSSGGSIVSEERNAIIATVVGFIRTWQDHISLTVLPISKFKKFYNEAKQGKRVLIREAQNKCQVSLDDLLKNLK